MVISEKRDRDVKYIPSDWELKSLNEICELINDGTHHTPKYVREGVPFYSVENVSMNDFKNTKYITEEEHKKLIQRCKPEKGDILLTRIGTLGVTKLINWDIDASIYVSLALLKINKNFEVNYIYSYTKSNAFVKDVVQNSLVNAVPQKINMGEIGKIQIPMPKSKTEQQRIATALSDMDDLVESLEKIIDKKKKIKQGTMQQLLTGKKRLPGFDGEWEKITLGDIGATYTGLSGKTKADFSDGNAKYIPFINVMNNVKVRKNELEKVKINKSEKQNKVYKWDLIFNTSSETPEEVGMCSVVTFKERNLYLNSFCFGFRLNHERHDTIFLSYYFRSSVGRGLMSSLAQGSTRYNLSKNALLELELYIPKYNEQQAIAEILSDMDAEIEALEDKLEKYKKLKEGMMQELLTGRIRLV